MNKSNTAEAVYLFSVLGISYIVISGISGFVENSGSAAGINALVCTLVSFLILGLCEKCIGGKDVFELTDSVYGKKLRFVIMVLFFVVTVLNASVRLGIYTNAVSEMVLGKTPSEVIAAIFCICAFFSCRFGIKSLSRYSLVLFMLFAVMFAIILCFSASEIKAENIFPVLGKGGLKNAAGMLYLFSDAVYIILSFRGRCIPKALRYVPLITGIVSIILTVFYTLCIPYYAADPGVYPLYTLASLANSSVIFQRLDGLVFIIWFFCGFVSVGALSLFATEIFSKNFVLSDRCAVAAPVVLLIFLAWHTSLVDQRTVYTIMTVITFIILPLTAILHRIKLSAKKRAISAVLTFFVLFFTGCYDNQETDTLATVLSVAVDKSDEGRKYTFSVADTSGKGGTDGGDSAGTITLSASGKNVNDAINSLSPRLSRNLSFSHLSAVLFSMEAAKDGMYDEVEYFEKKVSVRPQTHIVIVEGNAGKFAENNQPKLQPNSEKYFDGILNKNKMYYPVVRISDFLNSYRGNKTCFATVIVPGDESNDGIQTVRTGIVKNGKTEVVTDSMWLPAIISGNGNSFYRQKPLNFGDKPEIDVYFDTNLHAEITVSVDGDKLTLDHLEKDMEKELIYYASLGYDVADIWGIAARLFRFQKNYESHNPERLIRNASFDVIVRRRDN